MSTPRNSRDDQELQDSGQVFEPDVQERDPNAKVWWDADACDNGMGA